MLCTLPRSKRIGRLKHFLHRHLRECSPWSTQRHPAADTPRPRWAYALPAGRQHPAEHAGPRAGAARRCCSQRWPQISCLCATSAHAFHPDQIVRFGSYAYGQPHLDSDVALLVVMPCEGRPFRQAARLSWELPARRFPLLPAPRSHLRCSTCVTPSLPLRLAPCWDRSGSNETPYH
jgi:hypothetical protein